MKKTLALLLIAISAPLFGVKGRCDKGYIRNRTADQVSLEMSLRMLFNQSNPFTEDEIIYLEDQRHATPKRIADILKWHDDAGQANVRNILIKIAGVETAGSST